jgi:hypothetical protein
MKKLGYFCLIFSFLLYLLARLEIPGYIPGEKDHENLGAKSKDIGKPI